MKKIGLITFHASDNCGSMLQTYALQKVLLNRGLDVEIINFSCENQREMYSIFVKIRVLRDVVRNIIRLILYPILKREQNGFRCFWKYYRLSKNAYRFNRDLFSIGKMYDCIVCGSDQVWNYKAYDFDDAYLINFAENVRKVAYAVSMGQARLDDDLVQKNKYEKMISDFYAVSIREFKSQSMIQSITNLPVYICLDPTFLINEPDYKSLMGEKRLIDGDYIFCYAFTYHKQFVENVVALSKRLNMPVYMMDRKQNIIKCAWKKGVKLTPAAGPEAFLNVFYYASMIFTTSFHGTAFSVIFKKKFWYLNETGGEGDGRATSLLRQMGLMHRYVTPNELIEIEDLREKIDYDEVYVKLNELRMHSMRFIDEFIVK